MKKTVCLGLLAAALICVATMELACPPAMMGGVSGEYNPTQVFELEQGDVKLTIPAGATTARTITLEALDRPQLPQGLPGGVQFAGAEFGPDGTVFSTPAMVEARLDTLTILPALPVLTFDEDQDRWVGTGANAVVSTNGRDSEFALSHFSIAGIPDAVPIPEPGGPIEGAVLVLSNNGALQTDAISVNNASLLYSVVGDTFNVAAMSQEINDQGMIETKALGLDAILVTQIGNYVVGVVGGQTSIYNDGQFNEPLVGVMIMSVLDGNVLLSLYVATPERVIQGTLSGDL